MPFKAGRPSLAKKRGFTLVEVMVALLIVATALPALLMRIGGMATASMHARETAIAYWVAENRMQELLLTNTMTAKGTGLPKGRNVGDVKMAGETWDWQTEIKDSDGEAGGLYLKLTVRVRRQGEETNLAELERYIFALN